MNKEIEVLICPKLLKYTRVVCFLHKMKGLKKTNRMKRAATKMVSSLANQMYNKRLHKIEIPCLVERKIKGWHKGNVEKINKNLLLCDIGTTIGNEKKLKKTNCLKTSINTDFQTNAFISGMPWTRTLSSQNLQ